MASIPSWRTGTSPTARWVAARGLPTRLAPPVDVLDELEWRTLVEECAEHRLSGLLVAAVASHALPLDPGECCEVAGLEVELTRARMLHDARVVHVLAQFDGAGMDVRLLKGAALAHLDYPDPQWRPTGDIDVLVRADQLDAAVAMFVAQGAVRLDAEPVAGYAASVGKGAVLLLEGIGELDVHRLLVWGPLGVRLPTAELWGTSRSFELAGHEVSTLGIEETLLHVACHLMVGNRPRALSLRDVAQLMVSPDLDQERATGLARRWGAEAVLAGAVRLAVEELCLDEDRALVGWAAGYPVRLRDRAWLRVGRPGAALPAVEPLATLVELGPAERRVLVRATLRPSPGSWPGPAQRLERVVRRAGRALSGTR